MILRSQDDRGHGTLIEIDDDNLAGESVCIHIHYQDHYNNEEIFTDISKDEAIKLIDHLTRIFGL